MALISEKSNLREPIGSKAKDKDKDKRKDNENDPFNDKPVFMNDGRPLDQQGRPIDGQKSVRPRVPLQDPVAGPPPGLQPQRPALMGPNDAFRPMEGGPFRPPVEVLPEMPHDLPLEVLPDNHQLPGGQPGGGILNLDELLGPNTGGGGGGGD